MNPRFGRHLAIENIELKVYQLGEERLIVRNTSNLSLEDWHEYHKRGWSKSIILEHPLRLYK